MITDKTPGNDRLVREIWSLSALDGIRKSFYAKELEASEKETRVQLAMAHNVEPIPVDTERIRDLIDGEKPMSHSECLVTGFDKALKMVAREHGRMGFDPRSILSIHRMMLSDVMCEKGVFRDGVEDEIADLVSGYESASEDPLSSIESVIERFERIAPFKDGNKRMSYLLALFLLSKEDFKAPLYVPLDDSLPFIEALHRSYTELERRYPLSGNRKLKKRDRIYHIIETSNEPLSKRSICQCIPDVSIRTADVVLMDLMEENRIVKIGSYKDARYTAV